MFGKVVVKGDDPHEALRGERKKKLEALDAYLKALNLRFELETDDELRANLRTMAADSDLLVAVRAFDATRGGQGWWKVITVVQWLFFIAAVVGGVWLLVDVALAYMQLSPLPTLMIGRPRLVRLCSNCCFTFGNSRLSISYASLPGL